MTNLHFLKDNPEIAKNLKVEITASELIEFAESLKPKAPEVWLTTDQVREMLDLSSQTIINWEDSGILKPQKRLGRRKWYTLSYIETIGTK